MLRNLAVLFLTYSFLLLTPISRAADDAADATTSASTRTALAQDISIASRILADQGVLDAFGHVSARDPDNPQHFWMSRSLAPALVTPEDVLELDLDGNAIDGRGRALFLERFIHAEIYRRRPDVMAVVHSHSPTVIPFGVTKTPLLAMFHNAAFLAQGAPVFDIREHFGMTDMLIRNAGIGRALAEQLGDHAVVLLRGHGDVAVGPNIRVAVFRAIYTEVDARMQIQAVTLGGPIDSLSPEEGAAADKVNGEVSPRAWDLWKRRVGEARP